MPMTRLTRDEKGNRSRELEMNDLTRRRRQNTPWKFSEATFFRSSGACISRTVGCLLDREGTCDTLKSLMRTSVKTRQMILEEREREWRLRGRRLIGSNMVLERREKVGSGKGIVDELVMTEMREEGMKLFSRFIK